MGRALLCNTQIVDPASPLGRTLELILRKGVWESQLEDVHRTELAQSHMCYEVHMVSRPMPSPPFYLAPYSAGKARKSRAGELSLPLRGFSTSEQALSVQDSGTGSGGVSSRVLTCPLSAVALGKLSGQFWRARPGGGDTGELADGHLSCHPGSDSGL